MTAATLTAPAIRCQKCTAGPGPNVTSAGGARALGWRIFEGESLTGKPISHCFCPTCSGVTPKVDGVAQGWDAECTTCGATMSQEMADDDEEPDPDTGWTKKDAQDWQMDHECDPDVVLVPPAGAKAGAA